MTKQGAGVVKAIGRGWGPATRGGLGGDLGWSGQRLGLGDAVAWG